MDGLFPIHYYKCVDCSRQNREQDFDFCAPFLEHNFWRFWKLCWDLAAGNYQGDTWLESSASSFSEKTVHFGVNAWFLKVSPFQSAAHLWKNETTKAFSSSEKNPDGRTDKSAHRISRKTLKDTSGYLEKNGNNVQINREQDWIPNVSVKFCVENDVFCAFWSFWANIQWLAVTRTDYNGNGGCHRRCLPFLCKFSRFLGIKPPIRTFSDLRTVFAPVAWSYLNFTYLGNI